MTETLLELETRLVQAKEARHRLLTGTQEVTASTLGAGGIEALQSSLEPATTTLMAIAPYLEAAKWALLVITLVGIGVMLWARIDDSRKGLR